MSVKGKKKKVDVKGMLAIGVICTLLVAGVGMLLKIMLSDSGPMQKTRISTVTLLKPPPPPEQKDKLPEPEVKKEQPQKIETPVETPQNTPQNDQPPDNTPAGSDLGVDAAGGAGSDGFGLVGRKGGRSIIGGKDGMNRIALLTKYGWYTKKVQDEIWGKVKKFLDDNGGIPKGKHKSTVWLQLDSRGTVVQFRIVNPSGNEKIDKAIGKALVGIQVSEPPPEGMPSTMTVRVSSQG